MDDHEVLQHLLTLETEAASLVDEAQVEADKRISEAEKQNRLLYEETYAKEAEALEASYQESLALAKEDYRKQLESYRKSLETITQNNEAFFNMTRNFLTAKEN